MLQTHSRFSYKNQPVNGYRAIMAVLAGIQTKHIISLSEQNVEIVIDKPGGTCHNH